MLSMDGAGLLLRVFVTSGVLLAALLVSGLALRWLVEDVRVLWLRVRGVIARRCGHVSD